MSNEKNTDANTSKNPRSIEELHTRNFFSAIDDLFKVAAAHDFQEANFTMLNYYLEHAEEELPRDVMTVVFLCTLQNRFLTQLKETWELLKKHNPSIVKLKA